MDATFHESLSLASTPSTTRPQGPSRATLWGGRALSGFGVLFMLMDGGFKLLKAPEAVQGTTALGYSADVIRPLGILQLALLALYVYPRTAVVGAVLWTGYLGGAVATHVRVGNPWASHILFPLYVAALLWGGLYLRDARVKAMLSR